jgi:hypothetical protein
MSLCDFKLEVALSLMYGENFNDLDAIGAAYCGCHLRGEP